MREPTLKKEFSAFKDGVCDALLHGQPRQSELAHYYKRGYDFGLTLYADLKEA